MNVRHPIVPRAAFFLSLPLAIIWCVAAHAASVVLDDSGTQSLEPLVYMRWKTPAPPRSGRDDELIGSTTIRVRINVMPWRKRTVKIYLALPAQPPGPIRATWIAEGLLRSGQASTGNRVLVYQGPITTPYLEDVLKFQFAMNAQLMRRTVPVKFQFELDET